MKINLKLILLVDTDWLITAIMENQLKKKNMIILLIPSLEDREMRVFIEYLKYALALNTRISNSPQFDQDFNFITPIKECSYY